MKRLATLLVILSLFSLSACDFGGLKKRIDQALGKTPPVPAPPLTPPAPPVPPFPPVPAVPPVPPVPAPATQPAETAPASQPASQPATAPATSPESAATPTAPVPPTAPAAPVGTVTDNDLIEELNGYIECLNRTQTRTNDSRNRYLSWVSETAGPNCQERYISYGLYTLYEDGIEKCNRAVTRGQSGPPSLPALEKSASDLTAAYTELVPLTQKAEDYYRQQDYKDDACAKGKEMHTKLMSAFNRFREASAQLQKGVDGLKKDVDMRELARLEQEQGKKLAWQARNFGIRAKTLIQTVPEDSPLKINKEAYLAAFTDLDKAYESLTAYSAANREEANNTFWYSAFESSSKEFFTKAKFLKRDLAEGKTADGRMVQDLINQYNRFISDANSLRFR